MALRLRRDVQKASYYVWFLGAEEAKGLRGTRVINSVLPYLIDRSRGQEPLKVTLQVSHKGIKILQVSRSLTFMKNVILLRLFGRDFVRVNFLFFFDSKIINSSISKFILLLQISSFLKFVRCTNHFRYNIDSIYYLLSSIYLVSSLSAVLVTV